MRSRSSRRVATLHVEGLEDRTILSLLGSVTATVGTVVQSAGSVLNAILEPLAPAIPAQSNTPAPSTPAAPPPANTADAVIPSFASAHIQIPTGSDIIQALPNSSVSQSVVAITGNPVTTVLSNTVSPSEIGLTSGSSVAPTASTTLVAQPAVTGVVVVSGSQPSSEFTAPATVTKASASTGGTQVHETSTLTGAPVFAAANYSSANTGSGQAVGWVTNGFDDGFERRSNLLGRDPIFITPELNQLGSRPRDSQGTAILFVAAADDRASGDWQIRMSPSEAGLHMGTVADMPSVDLAIQHFLNDLNDLGHDVSQALARPSWLMAVGAVLAGAASMELARRRSTNRRRHTCVGQDESDVLSWIPGLPGSLGFDEA